MLNINKSPPNFQEQKFAQKIWYKNNFITCELLLWSIYKVDVDYDNILKDQMKIFTNNKIPLKILEILKSKKNIKLTNILLDMN